MKILGIDTSGSALSVALLDGGKLKAEDWLDHGLTHSQRLMPLLDELLRGAGTAWKRWTLSPWQKGRDLLPACESAWHRQKR